MVAPGSDKARRVAELNRLLADLHKRSDFESAARVRTIRDRVAGS